MHAQRALKIQNHEYQAQKTFKKLHPCSLVTYQYRLGLYKKNSATNITFKKLLNFLLSVTLITHSALIDCKKITHDRRKQNTVQYIYISPIPFRANSELQFAGLESNAAILSLYFISIISSLKTIGQNY